jgi:hypothetical protein
MVRVQEELVTRANTLYIPFRHVATVKVPLTLEYWEVAEFVT